MYYEADDPLSNQKGERKNMFKKLSDAPIAEVQNAQVAKWKEEDLLTKENAN